MLFPGGTWAPCGPGLLSQVALHGGADWRLGITALLSQEFPEGFAGGLNESIFGVLAMEHLKSSRGTL